MPLGMEIEVINYIKNARGHGLGDSEIKQNLLDIGWEAAEVDEAFAHVKAQEFQPLVNKDEDFNLEKKYAPTVSPTKTAVQSPTVHANIAITEQQFTAEGKTPFFKKPILWLIVAIIILAGAGFAYYVFAYNSPSKVWQKFISLTKNPVFQSNFTFDYKDQGGTTTPYTINVTGNFYNNSADPNNFQSKANLALTLKNANYSFNQSVGYIYLDKILYIDLSQVDALKTFLSQQGSNWVKIDLSGLTKQIENLASSSGATIANIGTQLNEQATNKKLSEDIQNIFKNSTLVKIEKYEGKEKINGVNTYHFKNTLDKAALKQMVSQMVDKLAEDSGSQVSQNDKDSLKEITANIIDKLEIKTFETWIGASNFQLYKVVFASNMVSFADLAANSGNSLPVLNSTNIKNRDAKRLADIMQMASALESYYNNLQGYPAGANGQPLDLTPAYMGILPAAPAPQDGTCTDYYNTYWYEPQGSAVVKSGKTVYPSYSLTFCLGNDTGGYKAGIGKLTPAGIEGNITCPTTPNKCVQSPSATQTNEMDQLKEAANKLNFSAEVSFEANYSDYGKKQDLSAPAQSIDLYNLLLNSLKTNLKF